MTTARHGPAAAPGRRQAGFTLIEVLVAIAIMGLALTLLYRILGSNSQTVRSLGEYQRATMLVQSLMDAHDAIPFTGWNEHGESGGFQWNVNSQPYPTPVQHEMPAAVPLYKVNIVVQWRDSGRERSIAVSTLLPQRYIPPQPPGG